MAKTNVRWFRLLVDEFDLSGDVRQVGNFGAVYPEEDSTGWSDGRKTVTLGNPDIVLEGYQALFAKDGTGRSFDALIPIAERNVSLAMGIGAAPAVGNPAFLSTFEQVSGQVDGTGTVALAVEFSGGLTGAAQERPFGVVLAPGTSLSATTNGTSVDNAAASTNGLVAMLHVTATASGSWTLKVQHSTNDSTWADLITFSANGSAITSERGTSSGTVNRYLRFQATRTAGTSTFWVTAARQ